MGVFNPKEEEIRGIQKHAKWHMAAKLSVQCCHLGNTNEELGGLARVILPLVKLLWSLL